MLLYAGPALLKFSGLNFQGCNTDEEGKELSFSAPCAWGNTCHAEGCNPPTTPTDPSYSEGKEDRGKHSLRDFIGGEEQQNRDLHSEGSCEIKLLVGVYAFAMHR